MVDRNPSGRQLADLPPMENFRTGEQLVNLNLSIVEPGTYSLQAQQGINVATQRCTVVR